MDFGWPASLVGLLFVLGFAALYVHSQTRRRRHRLTYSSVQLVRAAADSRQGWRRHAPAALYLAGLAALVFALARPNATVPIPEASGTVILVVDASRSMDATDVRPNRIEAAKAAIREFVRKEPKGMRIGVVAFSASAYLLTPPTEDKATVLGAVNYLSLGRGTNIGEGLQVALDAIAYAGDPESAPPPPLPGGKAAPRPPIVSPDTVSIILLSDGASTIGPDPLEVAGEIARAGVRTYTVGIGTRQGATFGFGGGSRQLDDLTLKGIADTTDGEYFTAENAGELHEIYGSIAKNYLFVHKEMELTVFPAAAGLLLLLASGVLATIWLPRLP
jgi:Ca-activated chloride channel family protein